jgi:hypothetical protein
MLRGCMASRIPVGLSRVPGQAPSIDILGSQIDSKQYDGRISIGLSVVFAEGC